MALKQWHCTVCEKDFRDGNWSCAGGVNHVVAVKQYFMNDAPTVADAYGKIDKHSTTQILNIPPERSVIGPGGGEKIIPGGNIWFARGLYETTDPEIQFWLDRKGGWCTKEEWESAYLSREEKLQIREMNLAARESRIISEENSLLERTQAKV
jgi:hypothetical protein